MAIINVSFDPEVDDYNWIVGIVDAAYADVEVDDDAESMSNQHVPGAWTSSRMRHYVKALAPDGRTAFRAMAENAPEAQMDDVKNAVGLDGMQYAGMMSTFGHARRIARGVHNLPFERHGSIYHIDEQVATLALAALDEIGA
jgi:hypothetical protein